MEVLEWFAEWRYALVVLALVIATFAYFLLIRRRREERDEARAGEASHERAVARWRRLAARDRGETAEDVADDAAAGGGATRD